MVLLNRPFPTKQMISFNYFYYLCFEGVVVTLTGGARLGATGWDEVFLRPSSSVSGLEVCWARWISSFLLHWKHKAVASAPSEFGSGCFKPWNKRVIAQF